MKYYHIYTDAEHNIDFPHLVEGITLEIGDNHNPYSFRNKNSATRVAPGISNQDITSSYISMLRESVFENVRLTEFPELPSRKNCLWVTDDIEVAKYWVKRIPHSGNKKIFELELAEGNVHETWEGHLTNHMENIAELEQRAFSYWRGEKPKDIPGQREIVLQGTIKILKEVS